MIEPCLVQLVALQAYRGPFHPDARLLERARQIVLPLLPSVTFLEIEVVWNKWRHAPLEDVLLRTIQMPLNRCQEIVIAIDGSWRRQLVLFDIRGRVPDTGALRSRFMAFRTGQRAGSHEASRTAVFGWVQMAYQTHILQSGLVHRQWPEQCTEF